MEHQPLPIVMRDGPYLLVGHGAKLPPRCIKCNARETGRKRVKLVWHSPYLYFLLIPMCVLLPVGLLLYLILSSVVSKRARIEVGLCAQHRRRYRTHVLVSWTIVLSGVALIATGIGTASTIDERYFIIFFIGLAVVFLGLIFMSLFVPVLRPKRIEKRTATVKGCALEFLRSLHRPQTCPACHYDLRAHGGDDEVTCPECGTIAYAGTHEVTQASKFETPARDAGSPFG